MAARNSVLGIDRGGFSYSDKAVFSNVSFALDDARTALVGENGAGKSTLLKCLTGELQLNEGQLIRSRGFRCGYLAQDVPEALLKLTLRQVLEQMLERIHSMDDWKIDVLLAELEIEPERAELPFGSFSGGWQRLILIAATTSIEEPDLLILDEPTNHLDLTNIGKLEDWLLNHTSVPMLIVSHDREFLERVTTRTVFLRSDGVHIFKVPFMQAREELLQRDMASAKQRALEDKEIDRLKKVANRYKAWGVLNSDFHKKQKATEKRIDKIQDDPLAKLCKEKPRAGVPRWRARCQDRAADRGFDDNCAGRLPYAVSYRQLAGTTRRSHRNPRHQRHRQVDAVAGASKCLPAATALRCQRADPLQPCMQSCLLRSAHAGVALAIDLARLY